MKPHDCTFETLPAVRQVCFECDAPKTLTDEEKAVAAFNELCALARPAAKKTGEKLIAYPSYIISPTGSFRDRVSEVTWWVRHELDLYEEGQETDLTEKTAKLARQFLKKHAPHLQSV